MRAGVAYCNGMDGFAAGRRVAQDALSDGGLSRADLVLAFCGAGLRGEQFLLGLRQIVGPTVPVIGGSAIGVMTSRELSYDGSPAGAAIIQWPTPRGRVATAGQLDKAPEATGRELAGGLPGDLTDQLLLLFYDSVKTPPSEHSPLALNSSGPLLRGLEQGLSSPAPIVGAGLVGDFTFSPPTVFCGDRADGQSAVAAALPTGGTPYIRITHGCTPLDGLYHTITKMAGTNLFELDGEPIVEIINDLYGNDHWQNQRPVVSLLTIGVNLGERLGEPKEEAYVNRLITGVLADGNGIGVFEPDLREGDEIQFMLRDSAKMIGSARTNASELLAQVVEDGRTPALGFYIDCAGRTAQESNTATEEAAEVQKVFRRHDTPLFGFYSGVEIAPFMNGNRGLDWTGVLTVFTKEEGDDG